ncbi:adaptor protein MecA [Schleiferilactobacillus shenzhenensis]|uniref:MecA n=1 Tax=Schleiferilactobacillus shenzhenensis LY-73 TaxID=1231336 RepID=U4TWD6_9LACO|nr:adaptor protein MecA [Schleiferilactobacillus shenzhenensis]ERL66158.1 MecA [Schleiferilactobacillus shenzhenensis LY-73]
MEMERINNDTIRVILGSDDLAERGVTVLDLLGNRKQIERFFYSILEEVDKDHTFVSNDAVTFQVMPNKNGLELLISKGDRDDDDEQQPHATPVRHRQAAAQRPDDEDVSEFVKRQLGGYDDSSEPSQAESGGTSRQRFGNKMVTKVLAFDDFEDIVALADVLSDDELDVDLYSYKHKYYLVFSLPDQDLLDMTREDYLAVANEYGQEVQNVTPELLSEHGKKLMTKSALHQVAHFFGQATK